MPLPVDRPGELIPAQLDPGEFEGRRRIEREEEHQEQEARGFRVLQAKDAIRITIGSNVHVVQRESEVPSSTLRSSAEGWFAHSLALPEAGGGGGNGIQ